VRSHTKTKEAFSLVEIVLAIGLFSALVLAMSGGFAFAIQSTQIFAIKNKASSIAEEGLEAVRSIRNESFANLVDGNYGLSQSGNKWIFSGTSDTVGSYTRVIQIATADSTTKTVLSTVAWSSPVVGSVSYLTYLTNWQRVVNPAWSSPFLASTLNLTNTSVGNKVAVSGNYAFVVRATGSPNFVVVNISNSAAPTEVFSTTLTGGLTDIFISGNFAYITSDDDNAELRIMNITTPTAPSVTTTLNMAGTDNASSVFVQGTKAYVGRLTGTEFFILDVSNPLITPTVNGSLSLPNAVNHVYVSGNFAYLATSNTAAELTIVNVTTPSTPVQAGVFNIGVLTTCSSINGVTTTILIGCANGIMYAINAATPSTPAQLGSFTAGAAINDISLNSAITIAFLGTSSATLEFQAVNISNLASMTIAGSLNAAATIKSLAYDSVRDAVIAVGLNTAGELIIIKTL